MQIIYPSDDFNSKIIEETYLEESKIAQSLGYKVGILDMTNFNDSGHNLKLIDVNEPSIWRGWMLKQNEYQNLSENVNLIVSTEQYIFCHHINQWYSSISEYTPKTLFFKEGDSFSNLTWDKFFVKDYVKSNSGKLGSIAHDYEQLNAILLEMKKYRGEIEGGICIREVIDLIPNSEKRYFVVNGNIYSNDNEEIPDILIKSVENIPNNLFYSVDIAYFQDKEQKNPIIIEIGDGQVSDIKEWTLDSFKHVLDSLSNMKPIVSNVNSMKKI